MNSFDPNFLNELIDHSHNPPGADPILGNFYTALVEMIEKGNNISDLLIKIKNHRKDTTYKHIVNLLFRSFQAIKFRQNDFSYKFFSVSEWIKELNSITSRNPEKKDFEKLLMTKSTTTTIYQRYAGLNIIISHLFDAKKVTIADFGCGGNYGLRGLELGESFKKIKDLTPKKIASKLLFKKINLKKGIAIDKEHPDDEEVKLWRMACSFYPQELSNIKNIIDFEQRIKLVKKVEFLQTDLLTTKKLLKNRVDIVFLSTILYQLNLEQQLLLLKKAKKLLKNKGVLIVQDFAAKNLSNPTHLDFNESWFANNFSYRTFFATLKTNWEFLEALQWNNGRCRIVKPGEDFLKIF